ncbi:MAG: hypothetical protein IKU87_00685 [Clostridia bacterium]|nr:hypothetical protein [Clostridia bacterium]
MIFTDKDKKNFKEENEALEVVYGNESFGIPADCTKKQKMSGLKLTFYIFVVAVLCAAIYGSFRVATSYFLPEITYDKSQLPLVYVKNSSILVKEAEKLRGVSVTESARFAGKEASDYVKMSDDGKYIFYTADNREQGIDLYCQKVSELDKDADRLCISKGISEFKISTNGRFVVYLKGQRLYYYNFSEYNLIDSGVNEFFLSDNNQQIVYFKEDGGMYTCAAGPGGEPELVDAGIEKLVTEENEYANIYYIKQSTLFKKEMGKESVIIAENVSDAEMLGDFVYFTKEEEKIMPIDHFFTDEYENDDRRIYKPLKSDYLMEDEDGKAVLDEEAYNAAAESYEKQLVRNSIREHFLLNPITENTITLNTIERGEIKELDFALEDVNLTSDKNSGTLLYARPIEKEEKLDISELESVDHALLEIENIRAEEQQIGMNLLIKDKAPFVAFDTWPTGKTEISRDRNFLYCIEDIDEDGRGSLVRYKITSKQLRDKVTLRVGVTDFEVDEIDSSVVVVFDQNKLGICKDGAYTHLSDNSCKSFFYVDGSLFFYDDFDKNTNTGTLKTLRDGKVKMIDFGVYDFNVRNLGNVVYIKHYNTDYNVGDLYYRQTNKRSRKIDICVRSILY